MLNCTIQILQISYFTKVSFCHLRLYSTNTCRDLRLPRLNLYEKYSAEGKECCTCHTVSYQAHMGPSIFAWPTSRQRRLSRPTMRGPRLQNGRTPGASWVGAAQRPVHLYMFQILSNCICRNLRRAHRDASYLFGSSTHISKS